MKPKRALVHRREFLSTALGASSVALLGCNGCTSRQRVVGLATDAAVDPGSPPDVEITMRAAPADVSILPGPSTRTWGFAANVTRGAPGAVAVSEGGYLGPTLRVKRGQRARIQLDNDLDEPTIVHWHGLDVDDRNDGHPRFAVQPGHRYTYDFEIDNRAGLYWYHTHPADRTAPQVYLGLAGLLIVTDDEEQRLSLPDLDRELTLVIQDRTFDQDNQLVYMPNRMVGFLGTDILVNGRAMTDREVARGPHRLRILNGSNSRIYDLGWSDGTPLTVLGTDGGLLAAPRHRDHVLLAPGQRLDVWASFGDAPGEDVWLESRAFDGVSPTMGMGGGRSSEPPGSANGAPFRIQRFIAVGPGTPGGPPPALSNPELPGPSPATISHRIDVSMRRMRWLLNDRNFEMLGVAPNEHVKLGAVEDWEFVNTGGGMMAMAHPIHLHGSQFTIVERSSPADVLGGGLFDEGLLDTFLLPPGDRVRIRTRYGRHLGLFLYHCHNLEHEDMGMMRNYLVEAS